MGLTTPDPLAEVTVPPAEMANYGWWCANDYPAGQAVASAADADSCFCVGFTNITVVNATYSCSAIGGYLTDIRGSDENNLVASLISQAYSQQSTGPQ